MHKREITIAVNSLAMCEESLKQPLIGSITVNLNLVKEYNQKVEDLLLNEASSVYSEGEISEKLTKHLVSIQKGKFLKN